MCGENRNALQCKRYMLGSPPRVRGKPMSCSDFVLSLRITPACAGKTDKLYRVSALREDHPRVCGENRAKLCVLKDFQGSPPRVRGKHALAVPVRGADRITPACAGKTGRCSRQKYREQDHPRVCGENSPKTVRNASGLGSPPRVRGKHFGNGVFPWLILVLSLNLL